MLYKQTQASQMRHPELSPTMTFSEAFDAWIAVLCLQHSGILSNARYISPRTEWDYRQYERALSRFFGEMRLDKIKIEHLREYHRARAACDKAVANWKAQAGANRIRSEVSMLVRIMKAAGAWTMELSNFFQPLQVVESDIPRAMTPEEQNRFLLAAAGRECWQMVYWYSLVALQTTASTNEMRGLRIGDIMINQGVMQIRRENAKNKYRIRTIPLPTPEVAWALERLIERAQQLGASGPHCYLFPFRVARGRHDVLRPMTVAGIRKPWVEIRSIAGLDWLRPYDLRHTGITRMAEAGVPIHVIMSFAGHMSMKMQQHYTTIGISSKRAWATSTWNPPPPPTPMPRQTVSAPQQDWRQQAMAAGWAPSVPAPTLTPPTWQEQAAAAGWNPTPQLR